MYKRILFFLIFLFYIISGISCFSSDSYAQEELKIKKVGDVVVISNPKTPIHKNGLKKRIVFKEDLSIGVVEGNENYMFGEGISFNTDED